MNNIITEPAGNNANIKLYDIFRKDLHLQDEKAQGLVQALDESYKRSMEINLRDIATKQFVQDEIAATKQFVKDEIKEVKDEIKVVKEGLHKVEIKLTGKIFWAGIVQLLAVIGSAIAIVNFMTKK